MSLTLAIHPVSTIRFGDETRLDETTLIVNTDELRKLVLDDPAVESADFEIVHPGESCRAGPIFDIVEPRAKEPGASPDWPGILSAPQTAGLGTTHVLKGAAVTVLREQSPGDSRGATGYVLEMSGEAADGSHYATINHLIIICHTRLGLPESVQQRAYRFAQIKVAVRLA
ncbi:MAG TPA: glycine/sarcosine/betaine reductase component B subunit, partial [Candidatus Saccharimonadales bacterium]|nr:glycine/sarcosine/betaine reductase component B subunit [Candidatus Saccharimonadales bacterium]